MDYSHGRSLLPYPLYLWHRVRVRQQFRHRRPHLLVGTAKCFGAVTLGKLQPSSPTMSCMVVPGTLASKTLCPAMKTTSASCTETAAGAAPETSGTYWYHRLDRHCHSDDDHLYTNRMLPDATQELQRIYCIHRSRAWVEHVYPPTTQGPNPVHWCNRHIM